MAAASPGSAPAKTMTSTGTRSTTECYPGSAAMTSAILLPDGSAITGSVSESMY